MALDYDTPSIERLKHFMDEKQLNQNQLSRIVWGPRTHRGVIQEWTNKPDPRSSTVVKVCRALDITMDSLFQKSDNAASNPILNGSNIVKDSVNVKIEMTDLKAENKALKAIIEEKDKRIQQLEQDKKDLSRRLDFVLDLCKDNQKSSNK